MRFLRILIVPAVTLVCGVAWAAAKAPAGQTNQISPVSQVAIRQAELLPAGCLLTLTESINLALKNQPSIRQAMAQVRIQTGLEREAKSRLLPDTSVTGTKSLAQANRIPSSSVSLSGNQLIFDFGRTSAQLTQAQRDLAASRSGLTASTANVVFSVKQAYYTLLRTNRLVQVFEQNLRDQCEHVAEAQARLTAGVAPRSDVLKAQAAAASASVDLVTARNNAAQARVALDDAMGVDVRSAILVQETTEPEQPVAGLDQAVTLAVQDRPEMRQSQEQVAALQAALKAAKTGNLPSISTSVNDSQDFGARNGPSNSWEWFLNLQWTPFDSGFTRGAVIASEGQLLNAQESLYTVRQTVSRDAVTGWLDLVAAREALTAAIAEVASARENLAAATGRYEAGIGILLEILDAQAALLKAEVDEAVAQYGLSIARAELEHATGASTTRRTYQ